MFGIYPYLDAGSVQSKTKTQSNQYDDKFYNAAYYGDIATLQQLIQYVDVNAARSDGGTPLYIAAHNGHRECVQLLLEHGADTTARFKNTSALAIAKMRHHKEVAHLIKQRILDNIEPDAECPICLENKVTAQADVKLNFVCKKR